MKAMKRLLSKITYMQITTLIPKVMSVSSKKAAKL